MKKTPVFCFLLLMLVFVSHGQTEKSGFVFRPAVGIAGTQVDGDNYSGFNKMGLFGGVFVGRYFKEDLMGSFGMAFIQKGARKNANPKVGDYTTYRFNINYLDIPIQLTKKFKAIDLNLGFTYSQLISRRESSTNFPDNFYNYMHSYDIGWMLGAEKHLPGDWYLGVRYNYSLVPMRDFFTSPAQPQLVYYNFWGKLFNRGFYNNVLLFYFCKEINPKKKSESN